MDGPRTFRFGRSAVLATLLVGACSRDVPIVDSDVSVADAQVLPLDAGSPDAGHPSSDLGGFNGQVAAGDFAYVMGVTRDRHAIVHTPHLAPGVISLTGDYKLALCHVRSEIEMAVTIDGDAALVWCEQTAYLSDYATLRVWSRRHGLVELSSAAPWKVGRVRDVGDWLFFVDAANAAPGRGEVVVVRTDGSERFAVVRTRIAAECRPRGRFDGNRLLLLHCPVASPPGEGSDLLLVDLERHTTTRLADKLAHAPFYHHGGAHAVLVSDVSGKGWFVSVDGGERKEIADDVVDGMLLDGGDTAIFRSSRNDLRRVSVSKTAAPVTLVKSGVGALLLDTEGSYDRHPAHGAIFNTLEEPAVSPDARWMLYAATMPDQDGCSHIGVASTQSPGTSVLLTGPAHGLVRGNAFTADGRRALITECPFRDAKRAFAYEIPSGRATALGDGRSRLLWSARGSQVVYGDNFRAGLYRGRVDIYLRDLDRPNEPPVLMAQGAQARFVVEPSANRVVFALSTPFELGARAGLYERALP